METNRTPVATARGWVVIVLALAILLPSLYGFGRKFIELIATYETEDAADGAFAAAPIANYVFASLGFLMLFVSAAVNGMFRNIEGPKYTMLENERKLDQNARPYE